MSNKDESRIEEIRKRLYSRKEDNSADKKTFSFRDVGEKEEIKSDWTHEEDKVGRVTLPPKNKMMFRLNERSKEASGFILKTQRFIRYPSL